jgi:hypothetical protein
MAVLVCILPLVPTQACLLAYWKCVLSYVHTKHMRRVKSIRICTWHMIWSMSWCKGCSFKRNATKGCSSARFATSDLVLHVRECRSTRTLTICCFYPKSGTSSPSTYLGDSATLLGYSILCFAFVLNGMRWHVTQLRYHKEYFCRIYLVYTK